MSGFDHYIVFYKAITINS